MLHWFDFLLIHQWIFHSVFNGKNFMTSSNHISFVTIWRDIWPAIFPLFVEMKKSIIHTVFIIFLDIDKFEKKKIHGIYVVTTPLELVFLKFQSICFRTLLKNVFNVNLWAVNVLLVSQSLILCNLRTGQNSYTYNYNTIPPKKIITCSKIKSRLQCSIVSSKLLECIQYKQQDFLLNNVAEYSNKTGRIQSWNPVT